MQAVCWWKIVWPGKYGNLLTITKHNSDLVPSLFIMILEGCA